MPDPALIGIARAAKEGESYGISLLTLDGGIFNGFTQPPSQMADRSGQPLANEAALALAGGRARKTGDHLAQAQQEVGDRLHAMGTHLAMAEGVLTLAPAQWTPAHGQYVINFPVVRIAAEAVTAWWLVGGKVTEEAQQGGSWFVGGLFPIGN